MVSNFFITGNPINNQVLAFLITDTKLYVSVVTLSTQDNAKLLKQMKSDFQIKINRKQISIKRNNTETKPIFILINWSKFSGSK